MSGGCGRPREARLEIQSRKGGRGRGRPTGLEGREPSGGWGSGSSERGVSGSTKGLAPSLRSPAVFFEPPWACCPVVRPSQRGRGPRTAGARGKAGSTASEGRGSGQSRGPKISCAPASVSGVPLAPREPMRAGSGDPRPRCSNPFCSLSRAEGRPTLTAGDWTDWLGRGNRAAAGSRSAPSTDAPFILRACTAEAAATAPAAGRKLRRRRWAVAADGVRRAGGEAAGGDDG